MDTTSNLRKLTGYSYTEFDIVLVLIVIICFLGMAVFLYLSSVTGDLPHRAVDFGPPQRSMVKVCNPFVVELDESTKDLKDPLRLKLSILCPCHVAVVWGPKIQALHDLILLPGRDVRKKLLTDLEGSTNLEPLHCDVLMFEVEGKHNVTLPCPESVTSEALGEMPRTRYPASIFMFTPKKSSKDQDESKADDGHCMEGMQNNECTEDDETNDNMIIGVFSILHLRDNVVPKNSHIIAKYVKTAGIPIYSLQGLFVSSNDQPQQKTMESTPQSSQAAGPSLSTDIRRRKIPNSLPTQNQEVWDNDGVNDKAKVLSKDADVNRLSLQSNDSVLRCHNSAHTHERFSTFGTNSEVNNDAHSNEMNNEEHSNELNNDAHSNELNNDAHSNELNNDCGDTSLHSDVPYSDTHHASKPPTECVVCQSRPARCVLLPCRHNCVCVRCLQLLGNKCPLCRGAVESYFRTQDCGECFDCLNEEEEDDENTEMIQGMQREGLADHMENIFERVNHMVGFT